MFITTLMTVVVSECLMTVIVSHSLITCAVSECLTIPVVLLQNENSSLKWRLGPSRFSAAETARAAPSGSVLKVHNSFTLEFFLDLKKGCEHRPLVTTLGSQILSALVLTRIIFIVPLLLQFYLSERSRGDLLNELLFCFVFSRCSPW